jgi:hypothetical protein
MSDPQLYAKLKEFIGFGPEDLQNLRALAPLFKEHGAAITDSFYTRLAANPDTAPLIEGRVEKLKQTHMRWMEGLFLGEYGDSYMEERWRIGLVHVRVGIPPWWVEAVTSFLRDAGSALITSTFPGPEGAALSRSYLKILDIDLWLINLAYNDERLARLCNFTGMSRKLLERCVAQGK